MVFKSLSQAHASVVEENVSCAAASEASNLPNDSLLLHHDMPNKFKVW